MDGKLEDKRCADDGPFQGRRLLQEPIFAHCGLLPRLTIRWEFNGKGGLVCREMGRVLRVCFFALRGNCKPLINESGRVHPPQAEEKVWARLPRERRGDCVREIVIIVGKEVPEKTWSARAVMVGAQHTAGSKAVNTRKNVSVSSMTKTRCLSLFR